MEGVIGGRHMSQPRHCLHVKNDPKLDGSIDRLRARACCQDISEPQHGVVAAVCKMADRVPRLAGDAPRHLGERAGEAAHSHVQPR